MPGSPENVPRLHLGKNALHGIKPVCLRDRYNQDMNRPGRGHRERQEAPGQYQYEMPEQDPLIILLARLGIHGLVRVPYALEECQRLCPDVNRRTLQRDLKALVNEGFDEPQLDPKPQASSKVGGVAIVCYSGSRQ